MTSSSRGHRCALTMTDISKRFPGVLALDAASLSVAEGEIHGLVGENGAGKSTIIKVLAGVYQADRGSVVVGDTPLDTVTPPRVHGLGVRFIHQELSLVPYFSVSESVFMGQERSGPVGLDKRAMRRDAEDFLRTTFGTDIDGRALIRDLPVAQRKLVQIARALVDGQAKLVVFDEPTAALASDDISTLFAAIRSLRDNGIAMVYVSHYLNEIREICDRVTVFRNGTDVAVFEIDDDFDTGALITSMVGREITDMYPDRRPAQPTDGSLAPTGPAEESTEHQAEPALRVTGLGDGQHFDDISFTVDRGEIVGLAGIIGSGRGELTDALYGIRRARSGTVAIDGDRVSIRSPAEAVRRGLVLVPRDRRTDGLVLDMSVGDNINLATLDEVSSAGWLNRRGAKQRSDSLIEQLDLRPRRSSTIVRFLSGGNQQKAVLARWLATESKVFLLDAPTVGVDVGARSEIYKLITNLATDGAGVLVSSNDLGELLGICDRVLVMVRGDIVADVVAADTTLEDLIGLVTGAESVETESTGADTAEATSTEVTTT